MYEKGKRPQRQMVICPVCGNEVIEPIYKDRPYRCRWCRTVITDWNEAEKVTKKKR